MELFAIIDYLGYDLNRLTLIGLTLAIGIFIDDAIVVIENIMKKMEDGAIMAFQASLKVQRGCFFNFCYFICFISSFVPVGFYGWNCWNVFNSFAMTVALEL